MHVFAVKVLQIQVCQSNIRHPNKGQMLVLFKTLIGGTSIWKMDPVVEGQALTSKASYQAYAMILLPPILRVLLSNSDSTSKVMELCMHDFTAFDMDKL